VTSLSFALVQLLIGGSLSLLWGVISVI